MARKISHLLAALVNNASKFKRRWNEPQPTPSAANGLQGRWAGEWISEANGHRGALRCLLARSEAGHYQATFHAIYGNILRVCYTVPLHGQWRDGQLELEGDADLGGLAGGIYHYEGEAGEQEFRCTYRCKYDHGIFRMNPAAALDVRQKPRRRLRWIARLTAAVLAGVVLVVLFSPKIPEAYFQGRAASSWLREFFGAQGQQIQALAAFGKMGTNAEPVLLAALQARENPFVRMYRGLCARVPERMQQHLRKPDDPELLRMAAVVVLQHSSSSRIISDMYPLLRIHDSGLRLAVLQALNNRIPDASQVPLLVLPGNDPDPNLRHEVWGRLIHLGPAAAAAAPAVLSLCADGNIEVRQDAAWALWKITGQSHAALPVLENVLSRSQDAERRHAAAYDLLVMKDSNPFFIATLADSLTNSQAADRAIACTYLGQIGPPAAAALPALRRVLSDPADEVRRRAEVAISAINPQPRATGSP